MLCLSASCLGPMSYTSNLKKIQVAHLEFALPSPLNTLTLLLSV